MKTKLCYVNLLTAVYMLCINDRSPQILLRFSETDAQLGIRKESIF